MSKFFRIDGLLYKVSTVIYSIIILNFFWFLFSIPLITIGASTTALFYVTGKLIRKENIRSIFHAFWKSFKLNLKKATIIFFILLGIFLILYINIINLAHFGWVAKIVYPIQIFFLIELLIVASYIFPLLARHHITIWSGLKASFFIANRHLLKTILCLAVYPGLYLLLQIHSMFILGFMSIYGFWISFHLKGVFTRYMNTDKED